MAAVPNSFCVEFCIWMNDNNWLRLTPAQKNLNNIVLSAGIAGTPVTETQWKDFLRAFEWRYKTYLMNVALSSDQESAIYYYRNG